LLLNNTAFHLLFILVQNTSQEISCVRTSTYAFIYFVTLFSKETK